MICYFVEYIKDVLYALTKRVFGKQNTYNII